MLVVLARLGNPRMVGDFAFALALTAPVFVFATLNMRTVQATDQRGQFLFGDYVYLRIMALFGAGAAVACALVLGAYERHILLTVVLVASAKTFDALSDVVYGLLQQHERMRRIAVSRMLQGALQLIGLALPDQ
jgi:O-antigen/teichoic acid export membrane protein